MTNTFMNNLRETTNYKRTENGALAYKSTLSAVYDLFAFGGSYRSRSDEDCILLFKNAFEEDPIHALRCLAYIRDIREGCGERRFYRVCIKWLANTHPEYVIRNLEKLVDFGRWDDLYTFVGTPVETAAFELIKAQLALDVQCQTPSLLAKWLKSENTSSKESCELGDKTRKYLGMTHKQYRKTLSILRSRINVLEKLMSANEWDKIVFDKIPSRAGFIYRNAFARRDIIKAKYEKFAKDTTTKVNASVLYPYECVEKAVNLMRNSYNYWGYNNSVALDNVDRLMINKYWDNIKDVLNGKPCKMMCVCDTSASMRGTPINVAIGLSMYCAERIGGPYKDHYIAFSSRPRFVRVEGADFCDKVRRIYDSNVCENTNLLSTFELLRNTAACSKPEDRPDTIVVISDMEIDRGSYFRNKNAVLTEMESERKRWELMGLTMPHLVYWNTDARQNTILDSGPNVTYVSGFSQNIFESIVSGKSGTDLMLDKIDSERYRVIK